MQHHRIKAYSTYERLPLRATEDIRILRLDPSDDLDPEEAVDTN